MIIVATACACLSGFGVASIPLAVKRFDLILTLLSAVLAFAAIFALCVVVDIANGRVTSFTTLAPTYFPPGEVLVPIFFCTILGAAVRGLVKGLTRPKIA